MIDEFVINDWAKENISPGLLPPFVATCIQRALIKVQNENPDGIELCLQALWSVLDKEVIEPAVTNRTLSKNSPSFAVMTIYLVMNAYFRFRGNFKKGVEADLKLFRTFGVGPPDKLLQSIESVAGSLSQDLIDISKKIPQG